MQTDDFRTCDHCGEDMFSGYCINGGEEHYCSDECLNETYSSEQIALFKLGENNSDSYWTDWR